MHEGIVSGPSNASLPDNSAEMISLRDCSDTKITASGILSIISKASVLHDMAHVVQKLALSSPALNCKFLAFMSSALLYFSQLVIPMLCRIKRDPTLCLRI